MEQKEKTQEKRTLEFILGDETRAKIVDLTKKDVFENSFLYDTFKKAFTLIDSILINTDQTDHDDKENGYFNYRRERNNIVAFIGERGTGKTSCMISVYKTLANKNLSNSHLAYKWQNICTKRCLSLDVIDPTYFGDTDNILEIIIAKMFQKLKNLMSDCNKDDSWLLREKIDYRNKLIKVFQKVKTSLDVVNGRRSTSNDSIEELALLAGSVNLRDNINELVDIYLKCFEKDYLAIAIDDVDLQTDHVYDMLEQIRRYLIIPNVIILIGVKMDQLTDLIKQVHYKTFKDLFDLELLTDKLEDIAGRYLSKLIPYNHRIILPDIESMYDSNFNLYQNNKPIHFSAINIGVLRLIFAKTRYMFYDSDIKCSLIIPRNLRDLLNFVTLLYAMEEVVSNEESGKKLNQEIVAKNRTIFRNYFVQSWCSMNLSADMFIFIRDLDLLEPSSINKQVINFVNRLWQENAVKGTKDNKTELVGHWDSTIIYELNRSYNVSLADMYYMLDKISNSSIPNIREFVFAVKTVYSMMLCRYADNISENLDQRASVLYDRLYNDTYQEVKSNFLRKNNKLMIYSKYEKLVGGNFIRIKGMDPQLLNELVHLRKMRGDLLKRLLCYVCGLTSDSESNGDRNDDFTELMKDIDSDNLFVILEFLLLSVYLPVDIGYYRAQRRCYYDSILLESFKNILIYNSGSILFNIVKMRNYYELYIKFNKNEKIKEKEKSESFYFAHFFTQVEEHKEHSLIYQAYKEKLLSIYIRNIDVLESLVDHLPHLDTTANEPTQAFTSLSLFFKKLGNFDYYLCSEEIIENSENDFVVKSFSLFKNSEILKILNSKGLENEKKLLSIILRLTSSSKNS